MSPEAQGELMENETGAYYIQDGKMHDITKPKQDKLPKVYNDALTTEIKDYDPNEYIDAEELQAEEVKVEAARKVSVLGQALLGKVAQKALELENDPKMKEKEYIEKHSPGFKKKDTLKLGALKMDVNETSRKVLTKLQEAVNAQNPDQKLDVQMSFKTGRGST